MTVIDLPDAMAVPSPWLGLAPGQIAAAATRAHRSPGGCTCCRIVEHPAYRRGCQRAAGDAALQQHTDLGPDAKAGRDGYDQ